MRWSISCDETAGCGFVKWRPHSFPFMEDSYRKTEHEEDADDGSAGMKIRILTENTVNRRGLLGEHGLSLLLEANGRRYLFDTGQTDVYVKNAQKLREDLSGLDGIILSHGHYDHCGGMTCFPAMTDYPPLYVREGAFQDKRYGKPGRYERIGIGWKKESYPGSIVETGERHDLGDGWFLLGNIGYENDFEPKPECFYIFPTDSEEDKIPDLMSDEQILVVETEKGLSLFMGCSHMGILNCIRRVQKEFPDSRIHTILAGMHLKDASENRVTKTIEALKQLEFDYLIPVHCTGITAIVRMQQELGERCLLADSGRKYIL